MFQRINFVEEYHNVFKSDEIQEEFFKQRNSTIRTTKNGFGPQNQEEQVIFPQISKCSMRHQSQKQLLSVSQISQMNEMTLKLYYMEKFLRSNKEFSLKQAVSALGFSTEIKTSINQEVQTQTTSVNQEVQTQLGFQQSAETQTQTETNTKQLQVERLELHIIEKSLLPKNKMVKFAKIIEDSKQINTLQKKSEFIKFASTDSCEKSPEQPFIVINKKVEIHQESPKPVSRGHSIIIDTTPVTNTEVEIQSPSLADVYIEDDPDIELVQPATPNVQRGPALDFEQPTRKKSSENLNQLMGIFNKAIQKQVNNQHQDAMDRLEREMQEYRKSECCIDRHKLERALNLEQENDHECDHIYSKKGFIKERKKLLFRAYSKDVLLRSGSLSPLKKLKINKDKEIKSYEKFQQEYIEQRKNNKEALHRLLTEKIVQKIMKNIK